MKKLHIISLGCSKNLVDSEVMLGRLREYELSDDIRTADVIIINTCGFIEAAKSESLGHIFEAIESRKAGALIVASGCLVARYKDEIQRLIPQIDILTGVSDFDKIDSMIRRGRGISSDRVFLSDEHSRVITGSSIHAFVKISEGCNQSCSFCAIPSFKGRLQSRSIDSILREIESLAKRGFQDISLIAQDSSSFLHDKGAKDGLSKLINAIDAQGAIKSARILYLYPSSTDFGLIDSINNSKIFQNYFDMPIQHISRNVLKSMNRSYKDVRVLLEYMRCVRSNFIRTSVIIGYPSESEYDFQELCEFLESFKFERVNVFEYSSEEGTKAFNLPELPKKVRTLRINKAKKIIAKNQRELFKSMVGKRFECIVEGGVSADFSNSGFGAGRLDSKTSDFDDGFVSSGGLKSEVSDAKHDFRSEESNPKDSAPYFYSARDMRWGKEIDGEILINDVCGDVDSEFFSDSKKLKGFDFKSSGDFRDSKGFQGSFKGVGYYDVEITESKGDILIGRVIREQKSKDEYLRKAIESKT